MTKVVQGACGKFMNKVTVDAVTQGCLRASPDHPLRSGNRRGLMAAQSHYICSKQGYGIPESVFIGAFKITPTKFTFGYKMIDRLLKSQSATSASRTNFRIIKPSNTIKTFCHSLALPVVIEKFARRMFKRLTRKGILIENTPRNVAIGCIYYLKVLLEIPMGTDIIVETCQISKATLTKVHNNLTMLAKMLLQDSEITEMRALILHSSTNKPTKTEILWCKPTVSAM